MSQCYIPENQWTFLALSHQAELCQRFKGCDDSIIPWSEAYFCSGATSIALQLLMIVVWIYVCYLLFYLLGSTADFLFAPTLSELSDRMRLPQRIAGVTFLAVGNGAPDIAATVAAIRQGNYPLSFGALTGAAMFVSSVVAGNIIRLQPKNRGVRAQGAMLRDVFFLLLTACYWSFVLYFGKVSMLYVGISLAVFVLFVTLTGFFDFWHHVLGRPLPESLSSFRVFQYEELEDEDEEEGEAYKYSENNESEEIIFESSRDPADDTLTLIHKSAREHRIETYMKGLEQYIGEDYQNNNHISPYIQDPEIDTYDTIPIAITQDFEQIKCNIIHIIKSMLSSLAEEDYMEFISMHFIQKIKMIVIFPVVLTQRLTAPVVTPENYHPVWLLLSCVFVFPFLTWWDPVGATANLFDYLCATIIGIIFSTIIFFLFIRKQFNYQLQQQSKPSNSQINNNEQIINEQKQNALIQQQLNNDTLINPTSIISFIVWIVISLLGFISTLAWIDILSGELVSIFTIGGFVLGWPQVLMGATLLAFGNSMGDFSTNTSMANQGKVSMAITACYSGPLFNILIGLCIGFGIFIGENGQSASVALPHVGFVGVGFMVVSGVIVFFASVFNKFRIPSYFGKVLMGVYVLYFLAIFPIAFLWKTRVDF